MRSSATSPLALALALTAAAAAAPLSTLQFVGDYQELTIPNATSAIAVFLFGAGGASGASFYTDGYRKGLGGGGSFVTGVYNVTPGQTLRIIVGMGGSFGASAPSDALGGGGACAGCATGGGRSAVQVLTNGSWVEIATAGGGGGTAGSLIGCGAGCDAGETEPYVPTSTPRTPSSQSSNGTCLVGQPFVGGIGSNSGGGGYCGGLGDGSGGTSWTALLGFPTCVAANGSHANADAPLYLPGVGDAGMNGFVAVLPLSVFPAVQVGILAKLPTAPSLPIFSGCSSTPSSVTPGRLYYIYSCDAGYAGATVVWSYSLKTSQWGFSHGVP